MCLNLFSKYILKYEASYKILSAIPLGNKKIHSIIKIYKVERKSKLESDSIKEGWQIGVISYSRSV